MAFYRIFHLDAGRKFFSAASIQTLIRGAAAAGFSQLELYLSDNQGFRFALDDMVLTTEFGSYDLRCALGDGYVDGDSAPDGSGRYLTEADMELVFACAKECGVEIVPCIEVPGHMGTILQKFPQLRYPGSNSSIDLTSPEAVAFAYELTRRYAAYFAAKGCRFYSFGADEFANDIQGMMGFERIYENGVYQSHFVPFFNQTAAIIRELGMIPRAFSDGACYNNDTSVQLDTGVELCYWTSGWEGYRLASPATLEKYGFSVINSSGDLYWVLGKPWKLTEEQAAAFDANIYHSAQPGHPCGVMFCVWCDGAHTHGCDEGRRIAEEIPPLMKSVGDAITRTAPQD